MTGSLQQTTEASRDFALVKENTVTPVVVVLDVKEAKGAR